MKYLNFVDLNGRHNCKFKFKVRVTWDKYNMPEYVLFNIQEVIARDEHDAAKIAKEKFLLEIMGTADKTQMKYLKTYVFDYLNAEMVIVDFPKTESELDLFNELYKDYPNVPDNRKIDPIKILKNTEELAERFKPVPVSEDVDKAAEDDAKNRGVFSSEVFMQSKYAFKAGAEWQSKQQK